jgi:hypothetical protein
MDVYIVSYPSCTTQYATTDKVFIRRRRTRVQIAKRRFLEKKEIKKGR